MIENILPHIDSF